MALLPEWNEDLRRKRVMSYKAINLNTKFNQFDDHWSPRVIAGMNDYQFKLAKVKGEFVWHDHPETDEVFIVIEGFLEIEFRDGKVRIEAGEITTIGASRVIPIHWDSLTGPADGPFTGPVRAVGSLANGGGPQTLEFLEQMESRHPELQFSTLPRFDEIVLF